MFSRRRFLGYSGLGMLTLSTGCQLPARAQLAHGRAWSDDLLHRKAAQKHRKHHMLGYPINMSDPPEEFFDWRARLFDAGIDAFSFNNVGNPFKASPIPFNTHDFERETIRHFAKLLGFPSDEAWGFLSHSGTDSNMHGMYMGRKILKGRTGRLPRAYFTEEAHYSIQILRDLLGLETVIVDTLPDGGMDPEDLTRKLERNAEDPALVVLTVGTTFKGAIDNVDAIRQRLVDHPSYLHLDAALFGGYLPYTPHAQQVAFPSSSLVAGARYDSIAVSCHKFFGFPSPAGLFITTQNLYDEFNHRFGQIHNPEYIHHVPGTITCSRDGVKPAEFYFFTTPASQARQSSDARLMLDNAAFLLGQMRTHFPQMAAVRANPMSNTVYFRNPGEAIVKKYSLASMHIEVDKRPQAYAHIVVMPHVSRDVLTAFLADLDTMGSS